MSARRMYARKPLGAKWCGPHDNWQCSIGNCANERKAKSHRMERRELREMVRELVKRQVELSPEESRLLYGNLWELYG